MILYISKLFIFELVRICNFLQAILNCLTVWPCTALFCAYQILSNSSTPTTVVHIPTPEDNFLRKKNKRTGVISLLVPGVKGNAVQKQNISVAIQSLFIFCIKMQKRLITPQSCSLSTLSAKFHFKVIFHESLKERAFRFAILYIHLSRGKQNSRREEAKIGYHVTAQYLQQVDKLF